jgi:transglutaminase-like putative cysteine protease
LTSRRHVVAGLAGNALSLWTGSGATIASEISASGTAASRKLRFTIQITNPKAVALENQILWMYLPAHVAISHELTALDVSVAHTVEYDRLGHSILKIQWSSIPAFAQRVIRVNCDLKLRDQPSLQKPDGPSAWLKPEQYIEVNDPQIQALAAQLKASDPLKTAQSIYEWIAKNLKYAGYIADDLGAQYALSERRGDCTEYAYLAVALARAVGIPARMIGGFVAERDIAPKADEYHNWAQLWINGKWLLLDAQKERWLDPRLEYITFRYFQNEPTNDIGSAHRYRVKGDFLMNI